MRKNKKRERKLNLDDLEIESFETTVASEVVGADHRVSCTCGCNTCAYTCDDPTCNYSCGDDATCNGGPC